MAFSYEQTAIKQQQLNVCIAMTSIRGRLVGWLLACLTSQQHVSVSQGRICRDKFTCCHTEIEVTDRTETENTDQTVHLTQSQYTDTGRTSPSTDPVTPGTWQDSHWNASFEVTDVTRPGKIPGFESRIFRLSRRTP